MSDGPLSGKVAIVTGASAGIGEAIAIALAGKGACVVLAARRLARMEATAVAIAESGGKALVVQTDVARQEDVEALVKATTDEFGRIDIVVNNADRKSVV